jgi:DNA processing protein
MAPQVCDECARRSLLLEMLAPYIELVATKKPGSRAPELLRLGDDELIAAIAPTKKGEVSKRLSALDPAALRARVDAIGGWACCRHDPVYPAWLRDCGDAPAALIALGRVALLRDLDYDATLTIVGSRRATAYGRGVARDLARMAGAAGLTIVSGMANGIDSIAHQGALDAGATTIAVLGGGPDVSYPRARWRLHREIAERGLLLSEMPPGAQPWRWSFPARNRIMAALATMTVVVEGSERSGSLITAEMAIELGRDVGAVPGPVTSWLSDGPNMLLRDGAAVIRGAQDVLDTMLGPGVRDADRHGPELEPPLSHILTLVDDDRATCDAIATAGLLPAAETAAHLAHLELLGYLRADLTGRYTRTLLTPPGSNGSEA